MTEAELIAELKSRYDTAQSREKVTAIHLFSVIYAELLAGHSANMIAEQATGHRSYGTEIRKGMRLARYVVPKSEV